MNVYDIVVPLVLCGLSLAMGALATRRSSEAVLLSLLGLGWLCFSMGRAAADSSGLGFWGGVAAATAFCSMTASVTHIQCSDAQSFFRLSRLSPAVAAIVVPPKEVRVSTSIALPISRAWRLSAPAGEVEHAMTPYFGCEAWLLLTLPGPLAAGWVIIQPSAPSIIFGLLFGLPWLAHLAVRRTRWAGELKTTDGSRVIQVIDAYRPSLMPMPDASDATWTHFDGTNRWVAFDACVGYARTLVVAVRRDYPLPDVPSIDRKTFRRIQWTGERVRAASGELAPSADARH